MAMEQLAAVCEEPRRFGDNVEKVPLSELQARLRHVEAEIVEILRAAADTSASTLPGDASIAES